MKTVLCFGDSNTWGWAPYKRARFSYEERWTGILRKELGEDFIVIEEGLCGRTTVWDDPIEGYKSGKKYLIPCLDTHSPIDLVIILLGTNDLKKRFSLPAMDIAYGVGVLINMVNQSKTGIDGNPPKVLLLAPPPIIETGEFACMFEDGMEKSLKFSECYEKVAIEQKCCFLDTSKIVKSSSIDGIHLEKAEHKKLGIEIAKKVKEII